MFNFGVVLKYAKTIENCINLKEQSARYMLNFFQNPPKLSKLNGLRACLTFEGKSPQLWKMETYSNRYITKPYMTMYIYYINKLID